MVGIPNVKSPIGSTEERRLGADPKMFQNRRDSSAAAETTVLPSGLHARLNIRWVWPVNSFTFVRLDLLPNFHSINWFSEKPCELHRSRWCLLHKIEHTCEPVSIDFSMAPLLEFHSLMLRSAVPPPLANNPRLKGHQSNALTAALCCFRINRGDTSDAKRLFRLRDETEASQMHR